MKSATRAWVRKAESDRRVAGNETAFPHPEKDAEKYLKALCCERGLVVLRSHDLQRLLVYLLPHESSLRPFQRRLVSLSRYAVDYRYPGFSASRRQMHAALRHAERVRLKLRAILGLPP